MAHKKLSGDIVKEYLRRFPNTPTTTLARKIYRENSKFFNLERTVYTMIQYYRGKAGSKLRKDIAHKEFLDQKIEFEMPKSHADDFEPYHISQSKILILQDLHFPYQDNEAIKKAINYGKDKKVNCIFINGDLIDFAGISRHEKDWRQRSINEEFEAVRTFLNSLRKHFPKAKIVFKLGNHDERWEKYLFLKAPELFDCTDFQLEVLLRLGELRIDIVKDKLPVKIGKLTVLHGHELAGGSGGVNPARATFLKTLDSVLVGHYHKRSSHDETTLNGDVISVQSAGCLCGLHPYYMPINKWQQGFVYVEHDIKTGEYILHNHVIIKGKIY